MVTSIEEEEEDVPCATPIAAGTYRSIDLLCRKLSADTLAVLGDFYSEREQNEKRFEDLKVQMEQQQPKTPLSMSIFSEDWNASQFWYSDGTATTLAEQLLDGATATTSIAIVSAPSVFVQLKNLLASQREIPKLTLLEFDQRFSVFAEFVHYDFQSPIKLPGRDFAIARILSLTDYQRRCEGYKSRAHVCTGERMEALILKLYPGIKTTTFEPRHAQDRLGNDFRCYANFESQIWKIID
ncbi:MAG: hypothetical protein Q9207_000304 [Kuettlingeria erythrocarpa]